MIDFLRSLLNAPAAPSQAPDAVVAVAALLVEAARADADYTAAEAATIARFLAEMFGLDPGAAAAARNAGEAAQAGAADLVRFTRVVKTALAPSERVALMEALWRVVVSDDHRDPHEDALLRKLAPLIAVSDRESAEARRRVMGPPGG